MASAGRAWRNDILKQLELRKAAETDPYTDLVNSRKSQQMIINVWIVAAADVGFKDCQAGTTLHAMLHARDIKMNTHPPNNMARFIEQGCVAY